MQTCGDHACHPERSEGSGSTDAEILRCAQDDSQDTSQVMSPSSVAKGRSSLISKRLEGVRNQESEELPFLSVGGKIVSTQKKEAVLHGTFRVSNRIILQTEGPCLIENNSVSWHKKMKGARQGLGRTGERLAAETLMGRGYRILERNFRCSYGEIDLVAEDEYDLIFIEVKTRRGTAYGRPEEAVTQRKQRKLLEIASYYLDLHACSDRSWRIDVVAVQLSARGAFEEIRIYQHAVQG